MILYILLFLISCIVLVKAGSQAIKCLAKIAKHLKWSEFTTAFLLMGFITSLPELFVGVTSALHLKPEISLGNVLGSNIINLTLAIALPVFIAGALRAKTALSQRTSIYTVMIGVLPILLMSDGILSRIDGVVLLLILSLYIWNVSQKKDLFQEDTSHNIKKDFSLNKGLLKSIILFSIFIVLLLLSAEGIVFSSSEIAKSFGIPLLIIGIVLVALGTNLPELVFSIKAASLGHKDMILGNLMGSVIANSSLVLGVTVLIHPIRIFSFSPYLTSMIFTVVIGLLFLIFIQKDKMISRKESFVLLFLYLLFILTQVGLAYF